MSVKKLFAVGFIFAMTAVAWFLLGGSLWTRTESPDRGRDVSRVEERWGRPITQAPPTFVDTESKAALTPDASKITADLKLDYRQLGLLWYATYSVTFDAVYEVRNPGDSPTRVSAAFSAPNDQDPTAQVRLDDFQMEEVGAPARGDGATTLALAVPAGGTKKLHVHYVTQGMNSWRYAMGDTAQHVRNFSLLATTDFKGIDFTTLSPTTKHERSGGWDLTWDYASTRAKGLAITIDMPVRQNPGDLACRLAFFAPVSLLFFLTVMIVITVMKKVEIHPMNYFFISAAFFAFHLLLGYLVDHIDVHAAFFISAAVSVFLVVSYLRLVTGLRFALVEAGLSQVIFLVGFSYAFFYRGFTGLAVTIGAVITLFVLMQVTGRVKWGEAFGPPAPPIPYRPVTPAPPPTPAVPTLPDDLPPAVPARTSPPPPPPLR